MREADHLATAICILIALHVLSSRRDSIQSASEEVSLRFWVRLWQCFALCAKWGVESKRSIAWLARFTENRLGERDRPAPSLSMRQALSG